MTSHYRLCYINDRCVRVVDDGFCRNIYVYLFQVINSVVSCGSTLLSWLISKVMDTCIATPWEGHNASHRSPFH